MAAAIKWYAGRSGWTDLAGSGLGFYGNAGFGTSVQVGQLQDSTFITSPDGTTQGLEANNCKKLATDSGVRHNGATDTVLENLANASGTLNVRFTFDSPVKTQNIELRAFDRVSKNNGPSGVTCYLAELIHPWDGAPVGSGDSTWINAAGSGTTCPLVPSPGATGHRPNGPETTDTRHDWYVAVSVSPNSIGSKTQFGLYFECEYL